MYNFSNTMSEQVSTRLYMLKIDDRAFNKFEIILLIVAGGYPVIYLLAVVLILFISFIEQLIKGTSNIYNWYLINGYKPMELLRIYLFIVVILLMIVTIYNYLIKRNRVLNKILKENTRKLSKLNRIKIKIDTVGLNFRGIDDLDDYFKYNNNKLIYNYKTIVNNINTLYKLEQDILNELDTCKHNNKMISKTDIRELEAYYKRLNTLNIDKITIEYKDTNGIIKLHNYTKDEIDTILGLEYTSKSRENKERLEKLKQQKRLERAKREESKQSKQSKQSNKDNDGIDRESFIHDDNTDIQENSLLQDALNKFEYNNVYSFTKDELRKKRNSLLKYVHPDSNLTEDDKDAIQINEYFDILSKYTKD